MGHWCQGIARVLSAASFALVLVPLGAAPALSQGQESTTSAMAAQTSGHPPPLLSTSSVTAVPSGKPVPALPIPAAVPKDMGAGLALPGSVVLTSPAQLACDAIRADKARARCEHRSAPPAPPAGGAT